MPGGWDNLRHFMHHTQDALGIIQVRAEQQYTLSYYNTKLYGVLRLE